jgi:4-diphosphocytidyl-2-C-methyl-D-erythritol kinase
VTATGRVDASARGGIARTTAQAKVNLFLHVLAREASGYHQIETLFCRLALGDEIVVRTGVRGRTLDIGGSALPPEGLGPTERNLAWRAASAYAEATGWPDAWAIEIDKRVPVGGGLGGGSADAGAVLRCLDALAPAPLGPDALVALAAPLGADVPFLTGEAPLALAWGRGERMLALPALPTRPVELVLLSFGVPTAEAYAWLAASRERFAVCAHLRSPATLGSWEGISRLAHNDFERVVDARFPVIGEILTRLREIDRAEEGEEFGAIALLAGSGSTVFRVRPPGSPPLALDVLGPGVEAQILETSTAARVVAVEVLG